MFDTRAIQQNFSAASSHYDAHAQLQEKVRARALTLAESYFLSGATIADIGCGTGAFAREAGKNNWNIIGLDISYGMCATAQNILPVINANADALPLADASVDGVFSSLMLQWANAPDAVIKEMLRVLKPSGTAIITTFVHGTLAELAQAFLAVDAAPHVSEFIGAPVLLLRVAHLGGVVLETLEHKHVQQYDDVSALMHALKNIGASNKHSGRKKSLMTPRQLEKLHAAYPQKNGKVEASWHILTMVIGKA